MKILIATGNKGKLKELQYLLKSAPVTLVMPSDIGLESLDVEENGDSLGENAIIKARAYAQHSGLFSLADDTGLFVDALEGRPGIYAARFGGAGLDDGGRRRYLLEQLAHVPVAARTARFECVIALANPQTLACETVHGVCEGMILDGERGLDGFGYDRLFLPRGETYTFAELADNDEARKNDVSHRGVAAQKILPILQRLAESS